MPVNKPLDRIFKAFPDEAPRVFLHMLEVVPLDAAGVTLEPLPRETAPPVVLPDIALRIGLPNAEPFIFHAEFEGRYRRSKLPIVARYGGALATQYRIPVRTVVLLLVRSKAPERNQGLAVFSVGETEIRHPFRLVRIWELDPAPLLNSRDPRLFPWAVMMNSTDSEIRAIASELVRLGDEELLGRFRILGGLRYHEEELAAMTGGPAMSLAEVVWEESSVFQDLRKKVIAESKQEGRAEEARQLLRAALSAKFAGLESLPELDQITDVRALEQILVQHVVTGSSREAVAQAIRAAASRA